MIKYARQMIQQKGFDRFTSEKVMDYITSHDKLYGDIIDTKDVIDGISNNMHANIKVNLRNFAFTRGGANILTGRIAVYVKDFRDDEYFHEMDHMANTAGYDGPILPDMENLTEEELKMAAQEYERLIKRGYTYFSGIEKSVQEPDGVLCRIVEYENEGIEVMKQKDYARLKRN